MLDKNGALSTYFFDENLYDENIKDKTTVKSAGLVSEANTSRCKARKWTQDCISVGTCFIMSVIVTLHAI